MTRISITLATAVLTLSLAPQAYAYAPTDDSRLTPSAATLAQTDAICVLPSQPPLAAILKLPAEAVSPQTTTVACNS